jgi:Tol biopolymer transport system component
MNGERVCFLKAESQTDVYLLPLRRGGEAGPARRLTQDESIDVPSGWMPDNRVVLLASNRNNKKAAIFKQAIDSDAAELLAPGPHWQYSPVSSPDALWVLYVMSIPKQQHIVNRIPIGGGSPEMVFRTDRVVSSVRCSTVAGGPCIASERDGSEEVVSVFDPMAGNRRAVTRAPMASIRGADISPDGTRIAFVMGGTPTSHIRILAIDGKLEREIVAAPARALHTISWDAEGRGFFGGDTPGDIRSAFLHIDLDGHARELWTQPGLDDIFGDVSHDGKYVAMAGATHSANVWTIEGLER